MQKLKLQVEILASQDGKDTTIKTKAYILTIIPDQLTPGFPPSEKTTEKLVHESMNTFDKTQEQELEHIMAAAIDVLTASVQLQGTAFGS